MDQNTLAIRHQDEDIHYRLSDGGYHLSPGSITISVRCEATGKGDPFPPCAFLCLENHLIPGEPQPGDVYTCQGGMLVNSDEVEQRAWGYFTFHVDQITQRWTVESVTPDGLILTLEAHHDDVNYHGAQARETTTVGRFLLNAKSRDDLWIPS